MVSNAAEVLENARLSLYPLGSPSAHALPAAAPTDQQDETTIEPKAHDTESYPTRTASLAERRGRRPMQLYVVNQVQGDLSPQSDQECFTLRRTPPEMVHWPSERSTPLPQYTSQICGDLYPDPLVSQQFLENTKQGRLLSYVNQQREAHNLTKESADGHDKGRSMHAKEPPPYLSRGAQPHEPVKSSSLSTPSYPVTSPGLRPLILPAQVAQKSTELTSPRKREPILRQLLLPQDVEERSQYEVEARVIFRAERDSADSSISVQATAQRANAGKIATILALLGQSGEPNLPQRSKILSTAVAPTSLDDIHGSFASLASTYGTTPSCSSTHLPDWAQGTLLLLQNEACQTDWEDEIISGYFD